MAVGIDVPPPEVDAAIAAYQREQVTMAAGNLRSAGRSVEGVVLHGRPATVLVDEVTRFGADLVMCGSRGSQARALAATSTTSSISPFRSATPTESS